MADEITDPGPTELWGGMSPERIALDQERQRVARDTILNNPTTDEQRAAQAEYVATLEAMQLAGNTGTLTSRQKRLTHAARTERTCREIIESTKRNWAETVRMLQKAECDVDPNVMPAMYLDSIVRAERGLAQALFVQGRFDEAIEAAKGCADDLIPMYQEFLDAELRDDQQLCDCPNTTETKALVEVAGKDTEQNIVLSNEHLIGEFPSIRRNKWVAAIRCMICGHLNLREELTPSAARTENARANTLPDVRALNG